MEHLLDVLGKESGRYEELLELSRKKTPVIIKGDLARLQAITEEEQEVVGSIQRMERERVEVTADIANVLNKAAETLKIPDLIRMLTGRSHEQQQLAAVHDRLRTAVHDLRKVNEQNRELLAHALTLVEFDVNLIQAMKRGPQTANYNKGAYSAGGSLGTEKTGFDARQ
jgi:flagellar biosynthesis/type III secretory pathway chaperone